MELLERHGPKIQQDLRAWAEEHVALHPNLFELLPADPIAYPHQQIFEHTAHGSPLSEAALINGIARDIDPRYDALSDAMAENQDAVELIGEILKSGQNVILGTDHAELIDIALVLVRLKTNLIQLGYEFDTSIIINKMVSYLGVRVDGSIIPATDLLGWAIDEVYMSIPSTASSKIKMTVPKKALRAYNEHMITHGIVKRQEQSAKTGRAMLLGVAMSGTVNKPLDASRYIQTETFEDSQINDPYRRVVMVIGQASLGIVRVLENGLTIPATAQLSETDCKVSIPAHPYSIRDQIDLNKFMHNLAKLQEKNSPDHCIVYDEKGNLPVLR